MTVENKANLDSIEVTTRLSKLKGWSLNGIYLEKTFAFDTFAEINRFLPCLARTIVACNHHPDFSFDSGSKTIWIRTTTFSEKGLTQADFDLAEALGAWRRQI